MAPLRERKQREEKPFAVMAANLASAARWVRADAAEQALLQADRAADRAAADARRLRAALAGVAPGLNVLGMMLPCTPIQFLLFHEAAGRPRRRGLAADAQELLLVMTSANPGGEPLVIGNDEALARLQRHRRRAC